MSAATDACQRLREERDRARAEVARMKIVEAAMAEHAIAAWRAASARKGLADHDALVQHADAMSRWSERLRMAIRDDITGDEDWLPTLDPADPAVQALAVRKAREVGRG